MMFFLGPGQLSLDDYRTFGSGKAFNAEDAEGAEGIGLSNRIGSPHE
jgi:hypothetical protein